MSVTIGEVRADFGVCAMPLVMDGNDAVVVHLTDESAQLVIWSAHGEQWRAGTVREMPGVSIHHGVIRPPVWLEGARIALERHRAVRVSAWALINEGRWSLDWHRQSASWVGSLLGHDGQVRLSTARLPTAALALASLERIEEVAEISDQIADEVFDDGPVEILDDGGL